MSHSSRIGKDGHEASNGTDPSDSTDVCHWMGTPASVSQLQKCRAGVACLEQDEQEGDIMDSVCRQKHTNSEPHSNTNACPEGLLHTDETLREYAPHSHPVTKDSLYMDMANSAHPKPSDGLNGAEGKYAEKQTVGSDGTDDDEEVNDDDEVVEEEEVEEDHDKVNDSVDKEQNAEVSVQPRNENPLENPPADQADSNSASSFDAPSSASTPSDQAPPLVPAPMPSSAPSSVLPEHDKWPQPVHVMAEVRVRSAPGRERVVRGMQDSKSLDGISEACGGGARAAVGRGGQAEGRRATISSSLELDGTVSYEGDLTNFITKNLEQKIKMSSRPSLDNDSDCSGPVVRGRGSLRRPADIPPIDPSVLLDLHKHTQKVANSVEIMLRSLNGTIQNMTALSVGYIQTYRDSVDSLGESVDMSIKGMYTLMARCEELDRSMTPIQTLAGQIRDIKRTLDVLETICK